VVDTPPAPSFPRGIRSRLDVRTIAESSLLLDVTVLLVLVRTFIPIPGFQGLIRLACPMPFVLLAARRGPRAGLVATAAAFVLLSTFIGPLLATQVLVFGGLGTLFAWAARRRWHPALVIVAGAILYGLLYLVPPFIFGLLVLRVDLARTLRDVKRQSSQFLDGLGHFQVFGIHIGEGVLRSVSSFGPGRALLDGLHAIALQALQHPLATLIFVFACYSLVNVWAYLIVSIEVFRRLPAEARRDAEGNLIDFFPVR
jgi:hypothetical protein